MPILRDCPLCGTRAMHGFGIVNGGMYYYHGKHPDHCHFYEDDKGKIYRTHLDLFRAVVIPRTPKTKANRFWIAAREADLTGHPRKAKKLYEQWKKAEGY